MNKILISVIIPSYNRANTVGETIESIMAQEGIGTAYDMEIVIGDDCSTDNAREVLEQYRQKYPKYIRLFFRENNMQLGANWAQCVKDCRGKYICNCDNDDYWHNTKKLLIQLDYMESHTDCNTSVTNFRNHNRKTGITTEEVSYIPKDKPQINSFLNGETRICNASIIYRTEFLKTHLDLDEFIRRRLSLQDWPAFVILSAYSDIQILPVSTSTVCVETESITRPQTVDSLINRYERDKGVHFYLKELFPDEFIMSEDYWEKYVNGRAATKAIETGQFKYAKKYGKNCVELDKKKKFCTQHFWAFYSFVFCKRFKSFLKRK